MPLSHMVGFALGETELLDIALDDNAMTG